uniref:Putative secreted protein n=1 Tax=Anopheles marajoara TaxID=58244 RepID=A0A2M4C945_9DIPT
MMVMFIVVLVALQNADRVVAGATMQAAVTTVRRHSVSRSPFFALWHCRGHTLSLELDLISFLGTGFLRRSIIHGFLERCITFFTQTLQRLATSYLIPNRTTG